MGIIFPPCLFREFDTVENSVIVDIFPNQDPQLLGAITLTIDDLTNRVWLTGTINFLVSAFAAPVPPFGAVQIEIYRNDPTFTTTPIFITIDSGTNTGQVNNFTTSFSKVDETPPLGVVNYFIVGRLVQRDPAVDAIIASFRHFTGAEIAVNPVFSLIPWNNLLKNCKCYPYHLAKFENRIMGVV